MEANDLTLGKGSIERLPDSFGALLAHYREEAGLTQLQLCMKLAALDYDVSESAIAMWETGKRLPSDPAAFHFLGICLYLSPDQEKALVLAYLMEKNIRDLESYIGLKREVPESSLRIWDSVIEVLLHGLGSLEAHQEERARPSKVA